MGALIELNYKDLNPAINTSSLAGKVAFSLVCNTKSPEFPKRNFKIAWIINVYAPHTALSLLKLMSKFHNSKVDSVEEDLGEWISNLEGLGIFMAGFGL